MTCAGISRDSRANGTRMSIRVDSASCGGRTGTGYVGGPHVSGSNPQRETKSGIRPTDLSAHVCLRIRAGRYFQPVARSLTAAPPFGTHFALILIEEDRKSTR